MAWPRELSNVRCAGFNRAILPAIIAAIDAGEVAWGRCNIFADETVGYFDWKGCAWELQEFRETVQVVTLIEGRLDDPDLTALVLGAKLESS